MSDIKVMIKTIVKRDGSTEAFSAKKINDWGRWAAQSKVDWSSVVMDTCSQLPETVTSTKLQETLIQNCIKRGTWSYSLMAGRLLAPHLHKTLYPEGIPTIKQLHRKLINLGLMVDLGYTDDEYTALNEVIDHERDFNQPEFSLQYTLEKYSIQNRSSKTYYETAQFTYMRVAMAISSTYVGSDRVARVSSFYHSFSLKKVSPPTPNYINLGTPLRGFASCCLIAAGDNVDSIGIADWLAYRMTAASAGIGTNYMTRSLGDPVRNGSIVHNGKLPYLTSMAKSVKANTQAGRGGAGTTYYNGFDPQADFISQLRNPKATEDKRLRDVHFALMTNRTFAQKVAKDEDAVAWNIYTAPELHEAFYSGDRDKFAKLYAEYEASGRGKATFSPRKLLVRAMNEAFSTGVAYLANMDEINRHTPFNEPIHSSNLCVAPETLLFTDNGEYPIETLVNQTVTIWNGQEWSDVEVRQTGVDQQLVTVTLTDGRNLDCTLYHKWYVQIDNQVVEKRTHELVVGDLLIDTITPDSVPGWVHVKASIVHSIVDNDRTDNTYCVTEPKRHMAVFNGILTGQCLEIAEPTYPYFKMDHTVATSDVGFVEYESSDGHELYLSRSHWSTQVSIKRDGRYKTTFAGDLKVGDIVVDSDDAGFEVDYTVTAILESVQEPEVAMCSLAAINVAEVKTDRDYEEQMYTALSMIDYCILNSEYPVPHIGFTAKQRMNAGVGIMGLATLLAEYQLKYDTPEGLAFIHRVAERHMYFAIKASLRISKERGNAPWIHKTKWVDGWTPVQTYAKGVDKLGDFKCEYDWDALSNEIRENGGIAHSCLVAFMPGESSSKALGQPNSIYPIRALTLAKTDGSTTIDWLAPEGDNPHYHYQSVWGIDPIAQLNFYAVFQKFTDQAISADTWMSVKGDVKVPSSRMIELYLHMYKVGVKTRYYLNSETSSNDGTITQKVISEIDESCSGGGCKI